MKSIETDVAYSYADVVKALGTDWCDLFGKGVVSMAHMQLFISAENIAKIFTDRA